MSKQPLAELLATAQEHQEAQPQIAIETLRDIVLGDHPNDAESIKIKEQALQKLANLYAKQHDATALRTLLAELRPLFTLIPKAKTAKIVRTVVDNIAKVPNSTDIQVHHCWLSRSLRCSRMFSRPVLPAAGGLQGAGAMGTVRKAHLPASANRDSACNFVLGDQRVHVIHFTHWQTAH